MLRDVSGRHVGRPVLKMAERLAEPQVRHHPALELSTGHNVVHRPRGEEEGRRRCYSPPQRRKRRAFPWCLEMVCAAAESSNAPQSRCGVALAQVSSPQPRVSGSHTAGSSPSRRRLASRVSILSPESRIRAPRLRAFSPPRYGEASERRVPSAELRVASHEASPWSESLVLGPSPESSNLRFRAASYEPRAADWSADVSPRVGSVRGHR